MQRCGLGPRLSFAIKTPTSSRDRVKGEVASANVRVNVVCPGITRTPMTDFLIGRYKPRWRSTVGGV
jgi:NAD(P)-dependent dehydrogenase (short-subunit alcohol dehydrogenase family)